MKKAPKKPIRCHNPTCQYAWDTASRKRYVSCPECLYKVKNPYFKIADKNLLDHFNIGENGVKIQDVSLATKYSPHGFIIDVYFRDGKAICEFDNSDNCKHVKYALSLPLVRKIFKKRGWKTE